MFVWKALTVCLVAAVATAASVSDFEDWLSYKAQFKKVYTRTAENERRFQIFVKTKNKITEHNRRYELGLETYAMGINQFADMEPSEFRRTTFTPPPFIKEEANVATNDAVPKKFDWRPKGAVTYIKNQGQCASCWSFGATGALEGQVFLKSGVLTSLSEQQLVDCSSEYGNNGCDGGNEFRAYEYIRDHGGIQTEASYPYEERDNATCRFDPDQAVVTVTGYKFLSPRRNETKLKEAVATIGPISVSIWVVDNFNYYKHGVFYDQECVNNEKTDHNVLIVGYGTDAVEGDYWLIKNQWDTTWGIAGYAKMARNKDNHCQISTWPVYPTL